MSRRLIIPAGLVLALVLAAAIGLFLSFRRDGDAGGGSGGTGGRAFPVYEKR